MQLTLLFTLFASFVAVSFAEDAPATITTSDLQIGQGTVDNDGQTIVPVVETVDGVPVTYHFSVVDGATVFINEAAARDVFGNFIEQADQDPVAFEAYLQQIIEASENHEEGDTYESTPALSLSDAVRRVAQASSS